MNIIPQDYTTPEHRRYGTANYVDGLKNKNPGITDAEISRKVLSRIERLAAATQRKRDAKRPQRLERDALRIEKDTARKLNAYNSSHSIRHENLDDSLRKAQRCRYEFERELALSSTSVPYTVDQWVALCAKYDHKCLCCGKEYPLAADHVIPVSRGGRNTIENIQPLCRSCNSAKGTKTTDYRDR